VRVLAHLNRAHWRWIHSVITHTALALIATSGLVLQYGTRA
jgi:hypothetical protein